MVSSSDFKLDTNSMDQAADDCKTLYEYLEDMRNDLVNMKDDLMFTWAGEGSKEFEKQFRLLNQQFADIIEDAKDMYEKIISAQESYIQADTNEAKSIEGKQNRY